MARALRYVFRTGERPGPIDSTFRTITEGDIQ